MQLEGFVDCSVLLKAGVYALCHGGRVVYIGQSKNLYSRIYAHKSLARNRRSKGHSQFMKYHFGLSHIPFDSVHIRPCEISDLNRIEKAMIAKYKPLYNTNLVERPRVTIPLKLNVNGVILSLRAPAKQTELVNRRI